VVVVGKEVGFGPVVVVGEVVVVVGEVVVVPGEVVVVVGVDVVVVADVVVVVDERSWSPSGPLAVEYSPGEALANDLRP
jgi:hypothetical protein